MSIRTEEDMNETRQPNEMTASGGLYLNHNETTAEDDEADADALADLPVTQADKIRGGVTDPAETTPSLRPPPPKLPIDAPKPTRG